MPPKADGLCLKNNEKIRGYFSNFYSYILIIYRCFFVYQWSSTFFNKKIIPFIAFSWLFYYQTRSKYLFIHIFICKGRQNKVLRDFSTSFLSIIPKISITKKRPRLYTGLFFYIVYYLIIYQQLLSW